MRNSPGAKAQKRVRVAGQAVAASSFDALTASVIPAVLAQADIYPQRCLKFHPGTGHQGYAARAMG